MMTVWERARRALATRLCMRFPVRRMAVEDVSRGLDDVGEPFLAAAEAVEEEQQWDEREKSVGVVSPTRASTRRASRSGSRSSVRICAICLSAMKCGQGQALFTAECSHKFHFHCISSNVQHGNKVCPICRASWKELPLQGPLIADASQGNPSSWAQAGMLSANPLDELPVFTPEPAVFDDDEQIDPPSESHDGDEAPASVEITAYTELPAVEEAATLENFAILIHLKAPPASASVVACAPLDLVTVLDVSGSMAGTKLALLKRAMRFLIQNLRPSDRLSVISFSTSAQRLFPLRKMTEFGQDQSLRAINSLVAGGGTNIAEGLSKAARVMGDRKARNPVSGIIFLSDGVDTHTLPRAPRNGPPLDYGCLVPPSILPGSGHFVPIHAFGFGSDHDSEGMNALSNLSRGTFSFVNDAVDSIQNAFAQCLGGLLSVVAQEAQLSVECAGEGVLVTSIFSGGYSSGVDSNGSGGFVDIDQLYADEEKDFLVTVRVPAAHGATELIRAACEYRDASTGETVQVAGDLVTVPRPPGPVTGPTSLQVEREWHRVLATEDMAAARAAAEAQDYEGAVAILESRRLALEAHAALSSDRQAQALAAELREMQEHTLNSQRYNESGGRAYMLSGLSSHSFQRATARGDSTDLAGLVHSYQTPSMVDMLHRSQALLPEVVVALNRSPTIAQSRNPPPPVVQRSVRPAFGAAKSFAGRSS